MLPELNEIKVSPHSVLKYHPPGLAPVCDETGAFHINLQGEPAYSQRFIQTFGFYCSYAAVETEEGWGHITAQGQFLYPQRYDWCGNYQEDICSVRDKQGNYFHIDCNGDRVYPQNYRYAGDFKDGIAVVCNRDGKNSHINSQGVLVHHRQYERLDVFHKGFARTKDAKGWFHITKDGHPAYHYRFTDVEPFYNGQALAQTFEGALVVINQKGDVIRRIL